MTRSIERNPHVGGRGKNALAVLALAKAFCRITRAFLRKVNIKTEEQECTERNVIEFDRAISSSDEPPLFIAPSVSASKF